VQNINNQQVVFAATSDPNIFVMRAVRVGPESNGRYTVIEGLQAGDRIVTDGSFSLRAEWLKLHPSGQ
jgi:multidrug efflux pump subunit AcrA (membrane-fusion protein)